MKKPSFTILLCFLLLEGCAYLTPESISIQPSKVAILESVVVISDDQIVKQQICDLLEQTHYFQKVICNQESHSNQHFVLKVQSDIHDPSLDYISNMGYAALTLGTLIRVSSSAKVNYRMEWHYQGEPLDLFQVESVGQTGMWTPIPLFMAFFGTSMGTPLNYDNTPPELQKRCLKDLSASGKQDCAMYRLFHQDSLAKSWEQIWEKTLLALQPITTPTDVVPFSPQSVQADDTSSCFICFPDSFSDQDSQYDLIFYSGQAVEQIFLQIISGHTLAYVPAYLSVIGLNYKLPTSLQKITFETEGQLAKHDGLQEHWESNAMIIARIGFLENALPISFAFGKGASYAFGDPKIEDDTNQLLNYFMVEADIGLPKLALNPRLLLRVHHRSGVFGVYCPDCGSNFIAAGIKFSL